MKYKETDSKSGFKIKRIVLSIGTNLLEFHLLEYSFDSWMLSLHLQMSFFRWLSLFYLFF